MAAPTKPNTDAATTAHVRRSALRAAGNPRQLAKAVRTVAWALELGLLSIDDVLSPEARQRRAS